MRVNQLAGTINDRNKLFNMVIEREPNLIIGGKNDQIRNLVHKAIYNDEDSFVKVGLRENLVGQIKFYQNAPKFQNFHIPTLQKHGEFEFEGKGYLYIIENQVKGESLHVTKNFKLINKKVVDIIVEIDHYPDIKNEILIRKEKINDPETLLKFKKGLNMTLSTWYDGSKIQYSTIFNKVLTAIEEIVSGDHLPLGPVHGEFNSHHIFSDKNDKISIIDWETFYCAGPRFYDLQEYLGRLLVFEGDFESAQEIITKFKTIQHFDKGFFKSGLYQKILGSLYESNTDGITPKINQEQEGEIVDFVEGSLN